MERASVEAGVVGGKEPLIKRVWYGVGKFAESQAPEAWEKRLTGIIRAKILPNLSPAQQEWAAKHQEAIRDACAYVGAGITTAEIVGGVLVLEKLTHVRELFFGLPAPKTVPIERVIHTKNNVIDPVGVLVKSVDHMPKGLLSYLRQVVRAGEHSGLDTFGQLGLAATLLTIFTNKANPEYRELFAELLGSAGVEDIAALEPGIKKLFARAYGDTAKQFRFDPNLLEPDTLYAHWMQENAPGARRVLQVSGIPAGRAKHLVGLMRASMHPLATSPHVEIQEISQTNGELPGFNFVLKKMLDVPPPIEAFQEMREAVRILSREGSSVTRAQRRDIERRIAGLWADHAMPNLAKRPLARAAFLAQLEEEGFPGMPRPTVQSLQEYLAREYLPVSRSQRVIDRLRNDLPHIDTVVAHHTRNHTTEKPVRQDDARKSISASEMTEQEERSREQSLRQREYNEYIRQLKSAVRKIKREERKAVVADIDARLAPERERARKISHIHEVARETPSRIKAVVKRVEALRARLKLRRELKEKAKAKKSPQPVAS